MQDKNLNLHSPRGDTRHQINLFDGASRRGDKEPYFSLFSAVFPEQGGSVCRTHRTMWTRNTCNACNMWINEPCPT